jgi:hypothetical protein
VLPASRGVSPPGRGRGERRRAALADTLEVIGVAGLEGVELATLTSANRLVKKREPEFRSRNGLSGTRIHAKFRYGWEKDLAQGHSFTAVDATSCDDLGGWHPRGLDVQSLRLTVRLAPWRRTLT